MIGDQPGKIKINHRIAPLLPGYGDNSVFNMLRLMPGVLAAGEQSSDLLIWGAYESHSKIQFDGFTIFGLKNFNDDIGVVNPLVLKDMEVFKGGYEAKYGDQVGGIVNITGKNGSLQKPSFTFNINNTTLNSLVELPVSKKSSFLAAYRQTFYELYDPSKIQFFNRRGNSAFDATVYPDYHFRDANLKYNYQDEMIAVELSLYGGGDKYAYNLERDFANSFVLREEEEKNQQWGGAFTLSGKDQKGNTGRIKLAASKLSNLTSEMNRVTHKRNGREFMTRTGNGENVVNQITFTAQNRWNFMNGYYIESGLGFESNNAQILRGLNNNNLIDSDTRLNRIFSYVQSYWPLGEYFDLKAGIRINYALKINKSYPAPRVAASVKLTPDLKLNASWGMYHQFLAKSTLLDSSLNYYYFWANSLKIVVYRNYSIVIA
nr:TonB-dependent receptor [Maribellus maritimus]